jgi:type I restriction enzyme R subunit
MNVKTATIDYRYLIALIQTHIPDEDVLVFENIEDKNIEKYIDQLAESNPSLAAVIRQFWEDMKAKPESYRGVDAMSAIEQRIDDIIRKQVEDFTKVWCTNINEVLFLVDTLREGAPINLTSDYDKYLEHCSNDDEILSKLQYKRRLKDAVVALVKKVRPLREK